MARYTLTEIQNKLASVGKNIVLIGEYTDKRNKTLFKHTVCGYEWMTSFDSVGRLEGGCPMCFRESRKLPLFDIYERLQNIRMMGKYINSHHKIEFEHIECGYRWYSKPCDILNGDHGCPKCAKHGFNPNKPSWSYIFERDNYIKYGITNNLDQRLKSHRRHGEIIVHYSVYHEVGQISVDWENNIKQSYGGSFVTKEKCPDGYTETLPIHLLESIID